jgi:hypothetical protein
MTVITDEKRREEIVENGIKNFKKMIAGLGDWRYKGYYPYKTQLPPKEVLYGLFEVESQWDPQNISPPGPPTEKSGLGLGQITLAGKEWEWYINTAVKYANTTDDPSFILYDPYNDLLDPDKNAVVAAGGLGGNFGLIMDNPNVENTWANAAISYFGCVTPEGVDDTCHDQYTDAAGYRQKLYEAVKNKYGEKAADRLLNNDTGGGIIDDIKDTIGDTFSDVAQAIQSATLVIGALIFGGLVIAGFYAASHPDEVKQAVSGAAKATVI